MLSGKQDHEKILGKGQDWHSKILSHKISDIYASFTFRLLKMLSFYSKNVFIHIYIKVDSALRKKFGSTANSLWNFEVQSSGCLCANVQTGSYWKREIFELLCWHGSLKLTTR